jgi:hypothetical protein
MKQIKEFQSTFFAILVGTLFFHYYFLTNFKVSGPEVFVGDVKEVKEISKGIFPQSEVSFEVSEMFNGMVVKTKKIVKVAHRRPLKIEVGKTYSVKAVKDWLCSYSKS